MPNFQDYKRVLRIIEQGDSSAFTELHAQYYPRIYEFILFKVASREDAEDLASQVFLETWKYLAPPHSKKIDNFQAFVYKVARRRIADYYQVKGTRPILVELDDPEEYTEVSDVRTDSLQQLLNEQDQERLIETVQKLPEPYKEIVALRFFEELEIAEIAEIIGKTLGNTRVLIHRSVKALQKIYEREGNY